MNVLSFWGVKLTWDAEGYCHQHARDGESYEAGEGVVESPVVSVAQFNESAECYRERGDEEDCPRQPIHTLDRLNQLTVSLLNFMRSFFLVGIVFRIGLVRSCGSC